MGFFSGVGPDLFWVKGSAAFVSLSGSRPALSAGAACWALSAAGITLKGKKKEERGSAFDRSR